jgi:hypothetical protein
MGMVYLLGIMVPDMKGISRMIRNKVMEYLYGKMVENMRAVGRMVNSMVQVNIQIRRIIKEQEKECGSRADY